MSIKRHVRFLLDHSARISGVLGRCERGMREGLTTLMYHRVLPAEDVKSYPFPSLVMEREAFAQQMAWLSEHADVLPLGTALERLAQESGPRERPLVSVTFDDGYDDNYIHAAPLLEESGLRGTFFATTDFVGGAQQLWFDRAAQLLLRTSGLLRVEIAARAGRGAGIAAPPADGELDEWMEYLKRLNPERRAALIDRLAEQAGDEIDDGRFAPMTPCELRELADRGHEIGSHTLSHPILPQLSFADLVAELQESRAILEEWIGRPVLGLAYPNGDEDIRVASAAADAGYTWGCTTQPGRQLRTSGAFEVPRFDMAPHHLENPFGRFDQVAFRAELSAFHHRFRRGA